MLQRKGLLAFAMCACLLGTACASTVSKVRDGPAGPIVDVVEAPAVNAVEQRFEREFAEMAAAVATNPPAATQAREISAAASTAMERLAIARLVYDATLRRSASAGTIVLVDAQRDATDAAYDDLQRGLGLIISPPI